MALNGVVSLNGVTEKQLAQIHQFKIEHDGSIQFEVTAAQRSPGSNPATYNQVGVGWSSDDGMKLTITLLNALLPK